MLLIHHLEKRVQEIVQLSLRATEISSVRSKHASSHTMSKGLLQSYDVIFYISIS